MLIKLQSCLDRTFSLHKNWGIPFSNEIFFRGSRAFRLTLFIKAKLLLSSFILFLLLKAHKGNINRAIWLSSWKWAVKPILMIFKETLNVRFLNCSINHTVLLTFRIVVYWARVQNIAVLECQGYSKKSEDNLKWKLSLIQSMRDTTMFQK